MSKTRTIRITVVQRNYGYLKDILIKPNERIGQ